MSSKREYYVYGLYVLETDELFYIGKGTGKRAGSHRCRVNRPEYCHLYVYRKIRKLWQSNQDFYYKILFKTEDEELAYKKESEMIAEIGRENLCNLTDGGDGSRLTEEDKKIISEQVRANPIRMEHLKNQSMKLAKKVRRLDTGEVFNSVKDAAKSINRKPSSLSNAIRRNTSCNEVIFQYVDEQPINQSKTERCEIKITNEQRLAKSQSFHNHPDKDKLVKCLQEQAKNLRKKIIRLDTCKIYDSISEASQDVNISAGSLFNLIKDEYLCNGIKFEYYDDSKEYIIIPRHIPKTQRMVRRTDDYTIPEMTLEDAAKSIGRTKESLYNSIRKNKTCGGIQWEYSIDLYDNEEEITYLPTCYV